MPKPAGRRSVGGTPSKGAAPRMSVGNSAGGTPRMSVGRRSFKRPGALKPVEVNAEAAKPSAKEALEKRLAEGFYPAAKGRTAAEIYEDKLKAELGDAYEPPSKRRKYMFDEAGNPLGGDAEMDGSSDDEKNGRGAVPPKDLPPALLKSLQQKQQQEAEAAAKAAEKEAGSDGESGSGSESDASSSSEESLDPEGNPWPQVQRLPISELNYLYFEGKVLRHEGTRHMRKGLVIIHAGSMCVQMYDRSGKQFGNRPGHGYPQKNADALKICMGDEVRLAGKTVRLASAIEEQEYLHGSFFLRKNQRRRELEKQRRKAEEKQLRVLARGNVNHLAHTGNGRITYGTTMVSSTAAIGAMFKPKQFRFYKAKAGYTIQSNKIEKDPPKPTMTFHDADREKAVVLFRAEYKMDSARRNIYSVVVDPVVGDKLRPHQIIGVQFMWDCVTGVRVPGYHGCILADEMGLGKSLQAITLLWTALNQSKYGERLAKKAVVVAPSSLVQNWCNEFAKWLGEEAIVPCAIAQSTARGERILNTFINDPTRNVLVISYDQLRKYENRFKEMTCVGLVICDEGHRLKNAEIKTTKAVDMIPTTRRVILSGTPLQNDLGEFHAMVNFCNPGIVGNLNTFKTVFEIPIMRGREPTCPEPEKVLGSHRAYYLATLTNNFILQRKQTINEKYLPSKIEQTVFVRPTEFQRQVYQAIIANKHLLDGGADDGGKRASPALVAITYLKKLCNHPDLIYEILTEEGKASTAGGKKLKAAFPRGYKVHQSAPDISGKMDFVAGLFTQLKAMPVRDRDKVVIVSNYTQTLDVIAALCKSMGVGYFQLDGSTPIKKRQALVDQFNVAGSPEIAFLLSSKAGGVGLNLVGANRLILYDPDWNPANDAQAMGRVWRDGQRKKVFIYRLLTTGSIEEKVYQRQVSKQGLSANVMDATDKSKQHFTNNDLKSLFTLKTDTVCETHDLLQCRCKQPKEAARDGLFSKPFKTHQRSGPRMDELKGWQHFLSADEGNDEVLKRFASMVSFIFANERESQTVKAEVEASKTFASDAPAVHCSQQGGDASSDEISVSSDEESGSGSESESESD
eukprot:TRINITY_DN6804_c0_g1_i1.p1 TRINITY_DN6804_c0_g1~~TRINITY_DN6804_c0_g1_i1.p1  ORF type:complete len:1079 (+),score=461.67 TRINITY_DN6804_c0_g1_i1:49-3285(+)